MSCLEKGTWSQTAKKRFALGVAQTNFIRHVFNKCLNINILFDLSCSHKQLIKLKQIEIV